MPEPGKDQSARHLALVALEALANYKAAGMTQRGDKLHKVMARRLARAAAVNSWEKA